VIDTAVILAAGMGSRIQNVTKDMPKGFITIENNTLIEMSVSKLIRANMRSSIVLPAIKANFTQNFPKNILTA